MCSWSFFFSSRRRHTRWPRDWSSDVCSSDLEVLTVAILSPDCNFFGFINKSITTFSKFITFRLYTFRSEERRVGKECRFRWRVYQYMKKYKRRKIEVCWNFLSISTILM